MTLQNRIKEFKRINASALVRNEKNWRLHPESQVKAIRTVLKEVGFASACLVRELEDDQYELIDGHLRADVAGDKQVPCLVLDVTEAEADLLLATFDPIAGMANTDRAIFKELLGNIQSEDEDLNDLLTIMRADQGIKAPPPENPNPNPPGPRCVSCPNCGADVQK